MKNPFVYDGLCKIAAHGVRLMSSFNKSYVRCVEGKQIKEHIVKVSDKRATCLLVIIQVNLCGMI
jgi:hypothetical protein